MASPSGGQGRLRVVAAVLGSIALGAGVLGRAERAGAQTAQYVVVGANELGMHCMNSDFSDLMLLPPFNSLRVQVIRKGAEPRIVASGVTVRYWIPGNTHSSDKANFWAYSQQLFGATIPPDVGLGGFGLSGTMVSRSPTIADWQATGVPITPIMDDGRENPYPLVTAQVELNGAVVARTQFVAPVSTEISCLICHTGTGESVTQNILERHDSRHGTDLVNHKPVNCSSCHADAALGAPGQPGVSVLSSAIHTAHAPRIDVANLAVNCYACHPGIRTNCQRDVHASHGMTCYDCHGQMADVGATNRRPWIDEPRCVTCHQARRPEFQFEPAGVAFKEATGHGGVKCVTCHSAPHAMTPATTGIDNIQSVRLTGHAGPLGGPLAGGTPSCTACHTSTPTEAFEHHQDD